jgi:hypothetical protein
VVLLVVRELVSTVSTVVMSSVRSLTQVGYHGNYSKTSSGDCNQLQTDLTNTVV